MRLRTVVSSLIVLSIALTHPASGKSAWDPNDVEGPLDVRWFGATYLSREETIKITVSFYDDFAVWAVPTIERRDVLFYPGQRGAGRVRVTFNEWYTGYFMRRLDGRLIFVYGDWASSCCAITRVRRPSADVLRVRVPTFHGFETAFDLRVWTRWTKDGSVHRDRSSTLHLGKLPVPSDPHER